MEALLRTQDGGEVGKETDGQGDRSESSGNLGCPGRDFGVRFGRQKEGGGEDGDTAKMAGPILIKIDAWW